MGGVLASQSELSLASAVLYFSGGVIALLSVTVFHTPGNPLLVANVLTMIAAMLVTVIFLVLGRRARPKFAITMLCIAAVLVLGYSTQSVSELRLLNSGLLFYVLLIYVAWFGQMWFARLFGYTWLAVYWTIAVWRFGDDMLPVLVTLTLTSVLLGEFVGIFRRRLEVSSLTDPLCGVWNTRGFRMVLSSSIRTMQRKNSPLSVLFLDLDDFKQINDERGHAEGDRVLRSFAEQVESASRPGDTLARVGGDEFVLMLPETGADQAESVAARLQRVIDAATWSHGVAELKPGESAEEFISRADRRMLERKAQRKAIRVERSGADRLSA